jgi:hypothetical protein
MNQLVSIILLLPISYCFSQNSVTGRIISDNQPVNEATVIFSWTDKTKTIATESLTDDNGNFKVIITKSSPLLVEIIVSKTGYEKLNHKMVILDDKSPITLSIIDGTQKALARLDRTEKDLKQSIEEDQSSINNGANLELIEPLVDENKRLLDSLVVLRQKIIDREISIEDAEKESSDLVREANRFKRMLEKSEEEKAELQEKIGKAYMEVVDCFCEGFEKDQMLIGFNVVDENHQFISEYNRREVFHIKVKKLSSLKKSEVPLIYRATGESFLEYEQYFPTDRILIKFETNSKEFITDKALGGQNYRVEIFNKGFPKPLKILDISDLRSDCIPRMRDELPSVLRNRPIVISKIIEVKSSSIKLGIYDGGSAPDDGDRITLILNGKEILRNYQTSSDKAYLEINLDPRIPNILVMYSESEGTVPNNKARIKIEDKVSMHSDIRLKSNENESEAVRIVVKE